MRASAPVLALIQPPKAAPRPGARRRDAVAPPPDKDAVVAYLASLPAEQRKELLGRVDRPAPPRPKAPSVPRPSSPRATLLSADFEVVAADPAPRSTVPPPLPARARSAPPPPVAAATAPPALLDGCESPAEAAAIALVAALTAVPSLAGLALLRDDERGGFVVVYSRGPGAGDVVRSRVAEADRSLAAALSRGAVTRVEYVDGQAPPPRHGAFGDPWTALLVPAMHDGRCVAVLELIDPLGGDEDGARLAGIDAALAAFCGAQRLAPGNVFSPSQVGLLD